MDINVLMWVIAVSFGIVVYSSVTILFANNPKQRVRFRVDDLVSASAIDNVHAEVMNEKKLDRKNKKNSIISKRFSDSLEMSGIKLTANEFLTFWACTTFGPLVLGTLFSMHMLAVSALTIMGIALPPMLVQNARKKREQLFNKQLSDALTIMGNCMRAGYSFTQAMDSVAKEMMPPISTEFGRVVREINYGSTMEKSLTAMVNRVNNKDLELLVAAVLTSSQVGANLSDLLDTIAETVTDRIRLREEINVMTAQGRMSGMIIGLLPVAIILFLMVSNPSYIMDFAATSIGQILLMLSVVMEITGFIVINKIVDLKY